MMIGLWLNMLYGITNNGERIRAHKNTRALCPHCRGPLIPKCGQVKVHHWAHKEAKGCPYASGMTHWHYEWLENFDNRATDGWEVEYFFKSIHFDAFNPEKMQAVEFQRSVDLDSVETKMSLCRSEGVRLFWLMSPRLFKNFIYTRNFKRRRGHTLFAQQARERKIDSLLDRYLDTDGVVFAIDFRQESNLPKYVSDEVRPSGWYSHDDAAAGYVKDLRMSTGIYVIRQAPHFNRRRWRKRTTLFLEHRKSHFS